MSPEERERVEMIYEFGEIERDAERIMQHVPEGGWMWRLFRWVARQAREEREALRAEA